MSSIASAVRISLLSLLLFSPAKAFAHPGHALIADGFQAGFAHPFTGADHLVTMIAVGILAARLGRRSVWTLPGYFVVAMIIGAAVGFAEYRVSFAELVTGGSAIAALALIVVAQRLPAMAPVIFVVTAGAFHGYAHGAEMPPSSSVVGFAAGFVLATGVLLALGVAVGRLAKESPMLRFNIRR